MKKKTNVWEILSSIILYVYVFAVFYLQYMFQHNFNFQVWSLLIFVVFSGVFTLAIRKLVCKINLTVREPNSIKSIRKYFIITFILATLILEVFYIAYWPGFYSIDSLTQYMQVDSGNYSDWHPILHTLLFFKLPQVISMHKSFGLTLAISIQLQILVYAFAVAYVGKSIYRHGGHLIVCVMQFIFSIIIPVMQIYVLYPWKDIAMCIFITFVMGQYINIVCTEGKWLEKNRNLLFFSVCIILATFMRHNAILFTAPLVLGVFVFYFRKFKKQMIKLIIFIAVLVMIIKGAIYNVISVEKPDNRISETTGICMAIMGNALVNAPEQMNPDVKEFLYQVSPKDVWESAYIVGDFNNVKFCDRTNVEKIDQLGLKTIIQYTIQTIKDCPKESGMAFTSLTGIIWRIGGEKHLTVVPGENYLDLSGYKITKLSAYVKPITDAWIGLFENGILQNIYKYIGWYSLIFVMLAFGKVRKIEDVQLVFHILPVLCYNFGTALLLTGYDWRFFFYVYPIIIPIIFLLIMNRKE